ncbi:SgcJ/EcaC family oxidoreductase [Streptomyces sp. UH6]|uniref:SgcJ/EcaC family oxidoreductase n=1 Tax=Streptomyces sp. UH6 TaxID=2748379 RepID=UPI0015D4A135|nr:SgcJ/EcaC family oxidoreductase [Streptomyces sp. UH6]NYV75110.1 SgcJ/EcaC family oxidoreductase [Streptomyces sp. UH6]
MTSSTHDPSRPPADPEGETAALHALVAAVERAQREEHVDGFVALFRADAQWTTSGGVRLYGRRAIAEFTAKALPGWTADGSSATYEVEHVTFVRPDVAAVKVRQRYFAPDGTPDGEGTPLYVTAKEDGRWLLTACQNTAVSTES